MKTSDIINLLETSSVIPKNDICLIILGGSRGCGYDDGDSDYDFNLYLRNPPKKWDCCLNTYGFVKIGKHLVHWYSHSYDLTSVNILPEIFYYTKMPLWKKEYFFPRDDIGQKYASFLQRNINDISLYFLKKLFSCSENKNEDNMKNFVNNPVFSPKWYYGLMLLANHFGFSNYSREEILECKNERIPPMKAKEGLEGIKRLKSFAIYCSSDFSFLLEENKKWKM